MLNFRMSDAVSIHLIYICLPYALFPIESTSKYLLVVVCVCKKKLNLNCKCFFTIRNFKTRLKMIYYLGKSRENIFSVNDFQRTIFGSVSGNCLKDLVESYIESKNVCKVKLSIRLFM